MNTYALWKKVSTKPLGNKIFTRLLCLKAPYFGSIRPLIQELEPEHCRVTLKKHRAVLNHINTVHAIAMCNMAELAAGMMTEVTVPYASHRWIPKGMTVEYLKKATTDLVAIATPEPDADPATTGEYKVNVAVSDVHGDTVFTAMITMWISEKH